MIRLLAVPVLLLLNGCAGLLAAGSAVGAVGGALAIANQVGGAVNATVQVACGEYEKGRAAANALVGSGAVPADAARKVAIIEEYGDAACADPPSGDALGTAIWLGELAGQLVALANVPAAPG